MLLGYNCKNAYSLDGGKSAILLYKGNTSTINKLKTPFAPINGKFRGDYLYFIEK